MHRCRSKLFIPFIIITLSGPTVPALADDPAAEDALGESVEALSAGKLNEALVSCLRAESGAKSTRLAAICAQHCAVVRFRRGERVEALIAFMRALERDSTVPKPSVVEADLDAIHECATNLRAKGWSSAKAEQELRGSSFRSCPGESSALLAANPPETTDENREPELIAESQAREAEERPPTWPLWTTGSIAVAGAGLGVGFGWAAIENAGDSSARVYAGGATIAWVAAGVAAGGFALLLWDYLASAPSSPGARAD